MIKIRCQISALYDIATQAPYAAGDAVYTARVMLNIDPIQIALEYAKPPVHHPQITQSNSVHIYPNPAKDILNIVFDQPISNEGVFEIWNMMGSKLITNIIPNNNTEQIINVSNLTSGIYIYIIKVNGIKLSSGKISIIK